MILVDTSVWVDHFRKADAQLAQLLDKASVLTHPFVIGELACGHLTNRQRVLALLECLPMAPVAHTDEVLRYLERHRLYGKGIGYVDAQLLASTALSHGAALWTRDRRLHAVAETLGIAHSAPTPTKSDSPSRS